MAILEVQSKWKQHSINNIIAKMVHEVEYMYLVKIQGPRIHQFILIYFKSKACIIFGRHGGINNVVATVFPKLNDAIGIVFVT